MFGRQKGLGMAAVLAQIACAGTMSFAGEGRVFQPVEHMASDTTPACLIAGAEAQLMRFAEGVVMTLHTRELVPGHVTTAWWVVMTRPENCSATPCSAEDVIGRAEEVGTQIVYADGAVNGPDGQRRTDSI